jgi:hypothetical protein
MFTIAEIAQAHDGTDEFSRIVFFPVRPAGFCFATGRPAFSA